MDDECWSEKGAFVDAALRRAQPAVVVELGTYVGYSTVRWAAQLKDGARLWSIDPEPASQASASRLLRKAGLADRVTLLRGTAAEWIPKLSRELSGRPIDFLFIDHAKDEYLPDLKRIEEAGLLHAGSVVAADNVLVFGLDEYVDHVRRSGVYRESRNVHGDARVHGGRRGGCDGRWCGDLRRWIAFAASVRAVWWVPD